MKLYYFFFLSHTFTITQKALPQKKSSHQAASERLDGIYGEDERVLINQMNRQRVHSAIGLLVKHQFQDSLKKAKLPPLSGVRIKI